MRYGTFFSFSICMMFIVAFNAFADAVIDDCEGKSQNKFGYYWFFFDDANDGGNSTLPGIEKSGSNYVVAMSSGGHAGNCLKMPYKLGPKATTSTKINYAGCGTMLCADKDSLNITGATAFTFWVKSAKATIVDFMVLTKDIKDYAYYHKTVATTTEWAEATVAIADLVQPEWGTAVSFNPKCVLKLQWQMHSTNVGKDSSGTLWLDDIGITGYTFIAPDQCPTCVGDPNKGTGALLSNMDVAPFNRNARNYFWFCYNDAKNRSPEVQYASDFSQILAGATIDVDIKKDPLIDIDTLAKKGYSQTNGAYLSFKLGPTFLQGGDSSNIVKPFIGVGTQLSNNGTTTDVYDASADGATGIYFDYMLSSSGATTEIKLEVYANVFSKGGVVHYVRLPATGATGQALWKGATIPFTKLKLPAWEGVNQTEALDTKIMKKLQWAVQDVPGTQGELAIDNVYFLGATKITPLNVKFRKNLMSGEKKIRARITRNLLKVSLPAGAGNAYVNLVDTRGAIAAESSSPAGGAIEVNIKGLSKGVYILLVKEKTNSGNFMSALPITIY